MVVRAALAKDGVELVNLEVRRTGIVVSLVDRAGERGMLSERASFAAEALRTARVEAAVAGADWVHVSGYPLADPASGDALADLVATRPAEVRCSVGGGSFESGTPIAERLRHSRPDLLLFDRGEGLVALGGAGGLAPGTQHELALALREQYDAVTVITDGVNPVSAATVAGLTPFRSYGPIGGPVLAVDATGAGDAFAAEVIGAVAHAPWPPSKHRLQQAIGAGVRKGAEVAAVVGAQAGVPSEGVA
jgi:sugar/nucleoside kinase (ribokinase family)